MLYKENWNKNTYKWMRIKFISEVLNSSPNAFQHGLFKIWNYKNFR